MESLQNILSSTHKDLKSDNSKHTPIHDLLDKLRISNQADWSGAEKAFAYIITIWIESYNKSLAGYVPPSISEGVFKIRRNLVQNCFVPALDEYINKKISEWEFFISIITKYIEALDEYAALSKAKEK